MVEISQTRRTIRFRAASYARLLAGAMLCFTLLASSTPAQNMTLSNFNGTGFQWTWDDFTQTTSANSVRVVDTNDAWGGAGFNQVMDLSNFQDSRFVVDYRRNPNDGTGQIDLELIDVNGNTGKWPLNIGSQPHSQWITGVSQSVLSSPSSGAGPNPALFDLSNVTQWQVLGDWGNTSQFDISFDNIALSDSASPSDAYPGQSLNAPWRAQAASQIDQHRKADLTVKVKDINGRAIPGANVSIEMQNHEFGFGSAVVASRLRDSNPTHAAYKARVAENFNKATLENNLKWEPWVGEWGNSFTQWGAVAALDWLDSQDIESRGHVAVWPGYNNLPQPVQNLLDQAPLNTTQQQQLRNMVNSHIDDIVGTLDGRLADWDIVNEPRTNHDIMDNLAEGDDVMATWFQRVAAIDPSATRYLNEFGILTSGGGVGTANQNLLLSQVQQLIANGSGIEGVGLQGHFSEGNLTGPEQIWDIIDLYADLGMKMQVTEFDFNTTNEQLQAEFTRDFMTAAFAHPAMEDFLMWGFWEGAHWRPEAAMYDLNWNIKPNGEQYQDLVFDEWWTDVDKVSDILGEAIERGFKGEYEITVQYNGQTFTQTVDLSDGGLMAMFNLNFALGDFSGDGNYACDDIDMLIAEMVSGNNTASFDITGDGLVDSNDLDEWLAAAGSQNLASGNSFLYGDANLDGTVDISDFNIWNSNKFSNGTGWCGGDFNGSGTTDISDFNLWNTHKFQSADSVAMVPEPNSCFLLLLGLVGFARRKRS